MTAPARRLTRFRLALLAWLQRHLVVTFLLMGLCFLSFGVASYNLVMLLHANLELFWTYGLDVAREGAFQQLLELLALGYFALLCYLGFKYCEKVLVDCLTRKAE
ncbi:MAG: hypothetical protein JO142_13610 [Burkholderiales bacterium]|nr:hypothetical protein [Burkholderiales bacterium]